MRGLRDLILQAWASLVTRRCPRHTADKPVKLGQHFRDVSGISVNERERILKSSYLSISSSLNSASA